MMLWDSVPDDELLAAAASGQLSTSGALATQARRMLASPKANATLARFLREWTQASALTPSDKDASVYPFFTAAYARTMNESFDRFAAAQLRDQGTVRSLLTSTDAYVDATLAPAYSVPAPPAGQWQKVSLDPTRYAGVATQALLLATNAHPNSSSYVFRGRMVRTRLLCEGFPAPPADAQAAFATIPLPADPTGKEVSAAVRAQPACAGCHEQIDPLGLAFEHFDGAARYRSQYPSGKAIDPTGTAALGSRSLSFSSNVDLTATLASAPELERCVALQMFRFAFSRQETPEDDCAVQSVLEVLHTSQGNLGQALLAVTATDAFTRRADP